MNKCTACGNEFESKRTDAKYCSDACRMKLKRTFKPNIVRDNATVNVRDKVSVPKEIDQYPNMTANKEEARKAIQYLETHTLEEIKEAGVWLPNWRKHGNKYPL